MIHNFYCISFSVYYSFSIFSKFQFCCVIILIVTQHYHLDTCPGPAGLPSLWPCPPSGRRRLPVSVVPGPCLYSAGYTFYRFLSSVVPYFCLLPRIDTQFFVYISSCGLKLMPAVRTIRNSIRCISVFFAPPHPVPM